MSDADCTAEVMNGEEKAFSSASDWTHFLF